jgi:ribulose-5-phosphate 4-epimerase/fuculose-1-phosphate aldolase
VGAAIHGAILEARPDVNCVFHTHTPYATAVSTLECGLLPMSQAALRFYENVAYHDYGRAGEDALERSRLGEDIGNKAVMLLRNHGVLATGPTAPDAFNAAFYLELACQFQVLAQSTGQKIILPQHASRVGPVMRAWPTLLRMLDREDPSYKE